MARGAQKNGSAGTVAASAVRHARICNCAECEAQGINAYDPANAALVGARAAGQDRSAPESGESPSLAEAYRDAVASTTPYCYLDGTVLPESRRGDLCDECKQAGKRPYAGAGGKMRAAMQPALVESDEDDDEMPADEEDDWPPADLAEVEEEPTPIRDPERERRRDERAAERKSVLVLAQRDRTMIGKAPGSPTAHLALMGDEWDDAESESDRRWQSACKFMPAVVGRMGFAPMPLVLVTCSPCRETMEQTGLGLKGGAASVSTQSAAAEPQKASGTVGNGKAMADKQRLERKQVERENRVEARGELAYERAFEAEVRRYMKASGETDAIKAAAAMQRLAAAGMLAVSPAPEPEAAKKAPKTERQPATRQPADPPVQPARRDDPGAPQAEPRQQPKQAAEPASHNERVLLERVEAMIEQGQQLNAALRTLLAERKRALGTGPVAVPEPIPAEEDDEEDEDFEAEEDEAAMERAIEAYRRMGGGSDGNRAAAKVLRERHSPLSPETWEEFKVRRAG